MKRFFQNSTSNAKNHHNHHHQSPLSSPSRMPLRKKSDTNAALVAAHTDDPPNSPRRARSMSSPAVVTSPSMNRGSGALDSSFSSPNDAASARVRLNSRDASNASAGRVRLNSRDIPRTYSGLYGRGDDLLPFELSRHGTLTTVFKRKQQGVLLGLYVTILILVQVVVYMTLHILLAVTMTNTNDYFAATSSSTSSSTSHVVPSLDVSWTITNLLHTAVSLIYIHWMKGSCLYPADDNGEMNGLTLWEQLDATPDTRGLREALMVVPCLLTWIACHAVDYQGQWSLLNGVLWVVSMTGKLPCMNGVRIFGINRTVGIDDDILGVTDDDSDDGSFFLEPNNNNNNNAESIPPSSRESSSHGNALLGIDEKKSQ